jgi:SNF2 family DNA or RNA helicase
MIEVTVSDSGSVFIDPTTLLPANSTLWKQSRVDIRKPSPPTQHYNGAFSVINSSSAREGNFRIVSGVPSRATATPLSMPSDPPRTVSGFIHPDTLLQRRTIDLTHIPDPEPVLSQTQAEEALKSFFESALTPEDEDGETKEDDEVDDGEGKVDGLRVTLMKHQIDGLKFLQDHECQDEEVKKTKGKGKGKYGGILADDVQPDLTRANW